MGVYLFPMPKNHHHKSLYCFDNCILCWQNIGIAYRHHLSHRVAYSVPPVQLKRHHLPAALAITVVRGVLVNLGMFLHFSYVAGQMGWQAILHNTYQILPSEIWVLTGFVVAFSIAIAWFKDMPDTEGDAKFRFKTLAIVYSPVAVLTGGVTVVSIAYIFAIYWSYSSRFIFIHLSPDRLSPFPVECVVCKIGTTLNL